jgi:hypothetical protein
MSGVSVNSEVVQKAIKQCENIMDTLSATAKSMFNNYQKVEGTWDDDKYRQFGDIVNYCLQSFKRPIKDIEKCCDSLTKICLILEKYERTNLNIINLGVISGPTQISFAGSLGGSYKECDDFRTIHGGAIEVHHIPSDSSHSLLHNNGPAIVMSVEDHAKTASHNKEPGAKSYREKQSNLIAQGDFLGAFQMDVDDIRSKFGNKYDEAILAAYAHLEKLMSEI